MVETMLTVVKSLICNLSQWEKSETAWIFRFSLNCFNWVTMLMGFTQLRSFMVKQTKKSIQQSNHNLSPCSVIETSCCFGSSQSQKEHHPLLLALLILFPLEDTRRLYRTESECHEHCRTYAQEPVCHGVVSGLRQVDFCVGRICSSTGFWVNGVNVQYSVTSKYL